MSATATAIEPRMIPRRSRRAIAKASMHWLRRGHLYFGLLLFPWAVLYGVTAFLFNHPAAFADRPINSFGPEALAGTPMAAPPDAPTLAAQIVAALQACRQDGEVYRLVRSGEATFTRDSAFVTVNAGEQVINVLIDIGGNGGTIRSRSEAKKEQPERAPFAIGPARPRRGGGGPRPAAPAVPVADALALDQPLLHRIKATAPVVLERAGFPTGDVTVTSIPDLRFFMEGHGETWAVTYSPMTGAVSGSTGDVSASEPLTIRQFLLRLHMAHGYPSSGGARWCWAVIVDLMASVMVFWGVSGLLMWWQIKSTRRIGWVLLSISAAAATALGVGMHSLLSQ